MRPAPAHAEHRAQARPARRAAAVRATAPSPLTAALLLAAGGLAAGLFGSLLGLGGGILIVPLLTLAFGYPLTTAIGTSLVCLVATSVGAASHNLRSGRADARLGVTLVAGTVVGAFSGGFIAPLVPERLLAALFALLLVYTAYSLGRRALRAGPRDEESPALDPAAPDGRGAPAYRSHRQPVAVAGSLVAGNVSGLLGVGGGLVTVPIVHLLMGAPLHVAAATSNFMIGMTAAAGAFAYLFRGDVEPLVAGPMVVGVAVGAFTGARISHRVDARWLALLFVAVVLYVALQMGLRALGVG